MVKAKTDGIDVEDEVAKELGIDDAKPSKPKKLTVVTWDGDPEAEMRRVFRVQNPPTRVSVVTLMQMRKRDADGFEAPAHTITLEPNRAQQYVLAEGAVEYSKQLAALRRMEQKGIIKEVDPALENVPWIPEKQRKIQELKSQLKKLEEGS